MDKTIKATDPQMIEEAIIRMKSIGFPQSYIDAFATRNDIWTFEAPGGEPHLYDEWENSFRCSFEDSFGGYAWAIIKEESIIEDERDEIYYFLYVSPDPEEWEKEREELAAMKPTMYRSIYHYYSEETETDFVKKAIRYTKEGALVFA